MWQLNGGILLIVVLLSNTPCSSFNASVIPLINCSKIYWVVRQRSQKSWHWNPPYRSHISPNISPGKCRINAEISNLLLTSHHWPEIWHHTLIDLKHIVPYSRRHAEQDVKLYLINLNSNRHQLPYFFMYLAQHIWGKMQLKCGICMSQWIEEYQLRPRLPGVCIIDAMTENIMGPQELFSGLQRKATRSWLNLLALCDICKNTIIC